MVKVSGGFGDFLGSNLGNFEGLWGSGVQRSPQNQQEEKGAQKEKREGKGQEEMKEQRGNEEAAEGEEHAQLEKDKN
eukprot:12356183-Karenia_brevis.AAC.1